MRYACSRYGAAASRLTMVRSVGSGLWFHAEWGKNVGDLFGNVVVFFILMQYKLPEVRAVGVHASEPGYVASRMQIT